MKGKSEKIRGQRKYQRKKISEEEESQCVEQSVESGEDNKAKTKLAWYKLSGRGGAEVDEDGAVVLLEERVKENDFEAMWMLGLCCEYGMGCEKDMERAELLYMQSGEGKNVIGQFLAAHGKEGMGVGVIKARSL